MKKLFFTAIAMIAFSSASMANTIADEEIVVKNNEKKEISKETSVVKQLHPCVYVGFAVSDAIIENGGTGAQAVAGADAAYAMCMSFFG